MCDAAGVAPGDLRAWLGPCIGLLAFEVGADVLEAFPDDARHVVKAPRPDGAMRWRADLPAIVRDRLARVGVAEVDGGTWCTFADAARFYSFRRDGKTGRHAAAVWIRAR
jgi:copper oxidase (laccase) domain-containing protein